jgi:hypothetical protein
VEATWWDLMEKVASSSPPRGQSSLALQVLLRWVNSVLQEIGPDCLIKDLFADIATGTPLLCVTPPTRPNDSLMYLRPSNVRYLVVVLASEGDEFDQFDGFKPSGKAKMAPERAVRS